MSDATQAPAEATSPEATFDVIPLSEDVRRAVDAMGYRHPTPVQRAVFEAAAEGRNLVVQARTGTGKTAAFGLPIVDRIVRPGLKLIQALVLCPTRELALQVAREIGQIAQFRGVGVAAIYGGASMAKQVEAIQSGAQIVVGTPGRVLDHLRQGTLDPSGIRVLVLDEADEMLSMGFARELNAILETLPKKRQGLFFSATIPPDIERLAHNHLSAPEIVTLSSDQVGALEISHYVYVLREGDKVGQLVRILEVEDPESAVIFCNTRDETQKVAEALKTRGFDADWLNGDLPQSDRERVMGKTKEGHLRFLVATDVAARGIDISHLTHVICYDFPETAEQYVHRTGRTGRAGRTGTALSIVGPKDIGNLYLLRLTYKIRPMERQLPSAGELKTRAEMDLVQLFVDAFASRPVHADDAALARRVLTHDDAERIVAGLLRDHLGARGGDAPTAAAEQRRARNPEPDTERPSAQPPEPTEQHRPKPRESRPRRGGAVAPAPAHRDWPPIGEETIPEHPLPGVSISDMPGPSPAPDGTTASFVQLFVNVGRRDGVRVPDLQSLLANGGLSAEEAGPIRIRDRMSFVRVKRELFDRAVAALSGQVFGGRKVVVELARERG
jgi:ATP-dependent RNA helicase DeaD